MNFDQSLICCAIIILDCDRHSIENHLACSIKIMFSVFFFFIPSLYFCIPWPLCLIMYIITYKWHFSCIVEACNIDQYCTLCGLCWKYTKCLVFVIIAILNGLNFHGIPDNIALTSTILHSSSTRAIWS